jgi:hypothetical protein
MRIESIEAIRQGNAKVGDRRQRRHDLGVARRRCRVKYEGGRGALAEHLL